MALYGGRDFSFPWTLDAAVAPASPIGWEAIDSVLPPLNVALRRFQRYYSILLNDYLFHGMSIDDLVPKGRARRALSHQDTCRIIISSGKTIGA